MRRFPPPGTVEALDGGFKGADANQQTLAYVYGHADSRDAGIAKALTLDEARRIAANIAKLPSLLGKRSPWQPQGNTIFISTIRAAAILTRLMRPMSMKAEWTASVLAALSSRKPTSTPRYRRIRGSAIVANVEPMIGVEAEGGRRVYSMRVGGYAMPQITFVRLIVFAVVLFGSVVAASAGKKPFPTGGNKPMPTPTISCKQACMLGFVKCRVKVMDKENVCCTANQNRAIKFCLKALFECEYPCPYADPYRGFPKKE
jgi:hypothetical protein